VNGIKCFWSRKIRLFLLLSIASNSYTIPHYYCTAADSNYYPKLLNLIGSIHAVDYENLAEIAVFDLGFTEIQKTNLAKITKIKLYQVELVHPDLLKYFKTSPNGREVRGWYAWKPVVIKQALDLFPYVLYIDAGAVILKPLDNLFKHIQQQGYFLMTCGPHTIADTITKNIKGRLLSNLPDRQLAKVLAPDSFKISAGLQGLSRDHKIAYYNYLLPMHQHAHDLALFADDGTSKNGFGSGRHDQPLFSIYAYLNNLAINSEGVSHLIVDGQDQQIHIHWHPDCISEQHTAIFQCRNRVGKYSCKYQEIKYQSANN
jgi:hypothetical protein